MLTDGRNMKLLTILCEDDDESSSTNLPISDYLQELMKENEGK